MTKSEKGFTLVELLITIAVSGIVFTVVAALIFQLSTVSGAGNNKLAAIHDLQNASYWFNRDGQMSVSASTGTNSLTFVSSSGSTVAYSWVGSILTRTENTAVMTLAQNISAVTFTIQSRLVSMNLTSTVTRRTTASENFSYQVNMRTVLP
jgi:prepilin-type N-terminal cleavage/methylation domain-containing protein